MRTLAPARRPAPAAPAPEPGLAPDLPLAAFHRRLGNAEALDAAAGGAFAPELWGSLAEADLGLQDGPRLLRQARGGAAPEAARPATVGGEPLPDAVRARMEAVFGHDFGHVRLHRGADAHQAARGLDAAAMAVGAHLFFAPGAWAPGTADGDRRIAHELAHVVQFDQGQVPADGGVSAPDDTLERAAEAAARVALSALPGAARPTAPASAPPATSGQAQVLCDRYPHTGDALDRYAERLADLGLRGMDRTTLAPLTGDPHDDALTPTEIETAFTALAEAGSGVARGWNAGQDDLGARTSRTDGDHAYWTPLHYGLELHRLAVESGASGYGDFLRNHAAMTTLAGAPMRVHPRTVWFVAAAQLGMDEAAGLSKTGDHYAAPAALTGANRRLRRTLRGIARTRIPRRRARAGETATPLDRTLPERYREARRELDEIERLAELHRARDAEADAAGEGREEPEAFAAWLLDPERQAGIDAIAEPTDAASAIAAASSLGALLDGAPGRSHGMGAMDAHGTDHAMGFAIDYGTSSESAAENRGVPDGVWPFLYRLMDDAGPPLAGRRPHAIHALSHEERSALSDLVRSPAAAALVERLSAEAPEGEAGPSAADRRTLRHSVATALAHARQALRDVLGAIGRIGRGPTAALSDEVAALRERIRGDLRTMGDRSPRDIGTLLDGYRPALAQLDAHVRAAYEAEGADERAWLDRREAGEDPGALPRGVRLPARDRRRTGEARAAAEVAAVEGALRRLDEARADRAVTGRLDGADAEADRLATGPAQALWERDREAALRDLVRTTEFRRWWRGASRTGIYSQPDAYAAGIASVHAHPDGGEHFYGGHHWEIADRRIITDDAGYRASLDRDMAGRGPEDLDRIVGILDEWDSGRRALDEDAILGAALEAAASGWRERRASRRGEAAPAPSE